MLNNQAPFQDVLLFSYVVASADMRYIEVSEREIHLRNDPDLGLVLRGEFSGCGPDCYVDLSQIFLEYALSCEGCKDQQKAEEAVIQFGERLGEVLGARFAGFSPQLPPTDNLAEVIRCILKSMRVPFLEERETDSLLYQLEYCPLCDTGSKTGLAREMAIARAGFAAFVVNLVFSIAPGWVVITPKLDERSDSLLEIAVKRA